MAGVKKRFTWMVFFAAAVAWGQIPSGDGLVAPNRPSVSPVSGESVGVAVKVANLREDNEATRKDLKDLTLRVEQLERENAALREGAQGKGATSEYVTKDELKLLEMRLNDSTKEMVAAESKRVESVILEELRFAAKKSQMAKSETPAMPSSAVVNPVKPAEKKNNLAVSEAEKQSYMKEGIRYTVQPGDTVSSIAKKNHSSVRAILSTNEIPNPGKLYVGRELFVPTL